MEYDVFQGILNDKCQKIHIKLREEQIKKFYTYMNLLLEWNEKMNLTAITEPNEVILKHFIDSLTISKYIEDDSTVIDMGTGAGFPGIPLKIVREDINITLVDSLNKRIKFLDEVIDKLDLQNIETVHARAEEFGRGVKYREKFDYATSRAVANLSTLAEYLIPLVKIKGKVISMKGYTVDEEIENSRKAINVLGGKISGIDEFDLPDSDIKRNIIIIEKIRNTSNKYPRKAGTPAKDPIR